MKFTRNEKTFCLLEYARTKSMKQRAFFLEKTRKLHLEISTKQSKRRDLCAGQRNLDDYQYSEDIVNQFGKHL